MISVVLQTLDLKASSSGKGRGVNGWVETDRLKNKNPVCIGEGRVANGAYDFDGTKEKEPRSGERIRIRRFWVYRMALTAGALYLQIPLGRVP